MVLSIQKGMRGGGGGIGCIGKEVKDNKIVNGQIFFTFSI